MLKVTLLTSVLLALLAACSSTPPPRPSNATIASQTASKRATYQVLDQHYREWKSVRYQLGGLNKNGIDCSGFVYVTYRDRFSRTLPRSTELQSKLGNPVSQGQLKIGDLVFFKTGRTLRHVGIYMGSRKFLHASTSKGVTISSLDNQYWSKVYWMSRRI